VTLYTKRRYEEKKTKTEDQNPRKVKEKICGSPARKKIQKRLGNGAYAEKRKGSQKDKGKNSSYRKKRAGRSGKMGGAPAKKDGLCQAPEGEGGDGGPQHSRLGNGRKKKGVALKRKDVKGRRRAKGREGTRHVLSAIFEKRGKSGDQNSLKTAVGRESDRPEPASFGAHLWELPGGRGARKDRVGSRLWTSAAILRRAAARGESGPQSD